jgi:trehalose 6-phosphate phosphatase
VRESDPVQNALSLFLDVDGTLLEIAPTPDAVHVGKSLLTLMNDVHHALGGAVALVSGRPLRVLDELFAPLVWPAAGVHGMERRDAAGRVFERALFTTPLQGARDYLAGLVAETPGTLLEDKGCALALHYRAAPQSESTLRRRVQGVVATLGPDYHLLEGKRVFEIKPTAGNKADAIRAFMQEKPFFGTRPIFVGDDATDLDGFAAVEAAGGISVAVGDRVDGQVRLASPRDVRALLADLAEGRMP